MRFLSFAVETKRIRTDRLSQCETGKLHILYFSDFALALRLQNEGVMRFGVERGTINAMFAGGFAELLPDDKRDLFVRFLAVPPPAPLY